MDESSSPEVGQGSVPDARRRKARRSPFRRPRGRPATHGAALLTRALRTVRIDALDGRSAVAVALRRERQALLEHVGEDATVPEQILCEELAKLKIITAAVGDWILQQQSLVRGDELLPVVEAHSRLCNNLAKLLRALGMKRHQAERTVADVFADQHRARSETT
ncbi:MAG TPA: hypothetical protein VKU61_11175 [Candidatus Binatia bacterium]|nr:hypothetical protein [Candidatus Binatia bacterium]